MAHLLDQFKDIEIVNVDLQRSLLDEITGRRRICFVLSAVVPTTRAEHFRQRCRERGIGNKATA